MNFFKTVAVAAAVVMAASPVLARQGNGGGNGGGGKSSGGPSASRSVGKSAAVRHAPFQRSQKPMQAGQRPLPQKTQTSQFPKHKQTQQSQHKPGPYFPNKQAGNHNKPFPNQMKPNHQKPYPNHMKPMQHAKYPSHMKWQVKSHMTKYHWSTHHYKFYKDSWGHYYNASNRCWFDGHRSYCGALPFRYIAGVWYYGEYKWYKTSYGWKCDAPEPPACDTCQTAYVAPAPKPVCQTCQAPAPAPEPVCDTCQAPPAPEPVQQPCETCNLPPPPCDTCSQDSL